MFWGALITESCERAGLTLDELAEKSGFPAELLKSWEYGHESPTVEDLERVVRAAGFTLECSLEPDDGIDRAQIRRNLRMTPGERLDQLKATVNFILEAREAVALAKSR